MDCLKSGLKDINFFKKHGRQNLEKCRKSSAELLLF